MPTIGSPKISPSCSVPSSAMPDAADRAEQARLGNRAANAIAEERHDELEHAHQHHRRHADLPREDRGIVDRHARLRGDERRAEHGERHADRRRRVESERHGGDVGRGRCASRGGRPPRCRRGRRTSRRARCRGTSACRRASAGKPNPPTRIPARMARFTTLSSIRPKNALTSPVAAHLYVRWRRGRSRRRFSHEVRSWGTNIGWRSAHGPP